MSLTKRWLEEISEELGYNGEITPEVIEEATSRQDAFLDSHKEEIQIPE